MPTLIAALVVLFAFAGTADADSICDPDGVQASGSIYRICMPASADNNGMLVVWAHGFQDAGTPVRIPEDQLCFGTVCIDRLANDLGFAFATNSYRKTGLAVKEGKDDILDLVNIFIAQKGRPRKIYLIGASEGGLITTLALEQHPELFSAGLAACGPVGSFPLQINYLGDARATFEYYFPGTIPGGPFTPDPRYVAIWESYYQTTVKPLVFHPAVRKQLDAWVKVARLPFDEYNYLETVEQSVRDVLRYSVVNVYDATETLGGFPFENRLRWYTGSNNDFLLNMLVPRAAASPVALAEMDSPHYSTTGALRRPLITMHTLRDQQVPFVHEFIYDLKTFLTGTWLTRHVNIPIDRFEHCNFTESEALFAFVLMLGYDAVVQDLSGVGSVLSGPSLADFEQRARAAGLPYRTEGESLTLRVRP